MVDPTLLNEQKELKRKQEKSTNVWRTLLFSFLGALTGAAVCVVIDYFIGNITGAIYFFVGMTACAFYQYFIEKKDQKKYHIFIVMIACLLATALAVFVSCMILYAPQIQDADMNFIEKTFELYRVNITENGFNSYKHQYAYGSNNVFFDLSILSFHVVCAIMSFVGVAASWLFISISSSIWSKKHRNEKVNYSYSSRKSKPKRKKKHK